MIKKSDLKGLLEDEDPAHILSVCVERDKDLIPIIILYLIIFPSLAFSYEKIPAR